MHPSVTWLLALVLINAVVLITIWGGAQLGRPTSSSLKVTAVDTSNPQRAPFLSVCTMIRNKAALVVEWVVFHHLQGVDTFLIVDDDSFDRDELDRVLAPYTRAGIVHLLRLTDLDPRARPDLFPYAAEPYAAEPFRQLEVCRQRTTTTSNSNASSAFTISLNDQCQVAVLRHGYALARFRGHTWVAHFDVDEFIFADPTAAVDGANATTLAQYLAGLPPTTTGVAMAPLTFGPIPAETLKHAPRLDGLGVASGQPTSGDKPEIDLVIELALGSVRVVQDDKGAYITAQPQHLRPRGSEKEARKVLDECVRPPGGQFKSFLRPEAVQFNTAWVHESGVEHGTKQWRDGFTSDAPIKFYHYKHLTVAISLAKAPSRVQDHRKTCYPYLDQPFVQQYLTMQNNTAAAAFGSRVRACVLRALDPALGPCHPSPMDEVLQTVQ